MNHVQSDYFVHPWSVSVVDPRRPVVQSALPLASRWSSDKPQPSQPAVLVQLNTLLTAREDITRLLDKAACSEHERSLWLESVLDAFEIGKSDDKHANHLSDDMQWRVLLAKAVITLPRVLLVGEGVKRLSNHRQKRVLSMLQRAAQRENIMFMQS